MVGVTTSRVFVGRLVGKGVFDPAGDKIGKVRDVVTVERAKNPPRVVGMIVEIPGKKRVFTAIGRITSIANGQVLSTGLINLRRYEQRRGETRLLAEMIGRQVKVPGLSGTARIEDAAIERTRSGEWIVSEVFVRLPKTGASPFSRGQMKVIPWNELHHDESIPTSADPELLIQTLVDLRPADLAEALLELTPDRRTEVVLELSDDLVADALEEMDSTDQLSILAKLEPDRAADVLDQMEPDDAADLIAELPGARAEQLLSMMEPEEAEDIRRLLEYEPDTAGGLMNPTPIILSGESSIAEGLAMIRKSEIPPAMASAVYITLPPFETPTGEYQGMVHFQKMLRFPPHERLSAAIDEDLEPVHVSTSAAEVARRLATYDLVSIPVVDEAQNLVGVVTIDDVLDHILPDDWRHVDDDSNGGA